MSEPAKSSALRELPSVDQLLKTEVAARLREISGSERLTTIAREVTDQLRLEILANQRNSGDPVGRDALLKKATQRMESLVMTEENAGLRHVINATGVILHTNLGRRSEERRVGKECRSRW